jgi:hypothetical protein
MNHHQERKQMGHIVNATGCFGMNTFDCSHFQLLTDRFKTNISFIHEATKIKNQVKQSNVMEK